MLLFVLLATAAPTPISVLYFDNNSGDAQYDMLGKGLADMMITDLSAVKELRVVEREKLEAILKELALQRSKFFDPKTAQKIGKGVGAELAVTGSFAAFDPDIRIDVRVVRISSGDVVAANKVVGKKNAFFLLQEALSNAIAANLVQVLGKKDLAIATTRHTNSIANARAYGTSLDAKDKGDLEAASDALAPVVSTDASFALAKKRFKEVMKDLYAAKNGRTLAMGAVEKQLLATLDPEAKRYLDPNDEINDTEFGHYVRTLIRGEVYLKRVADALEQPGAIYLDDLKRYLDNTSALIATLDDRDHHGEEHRRRLGYFCPPDGFACVTKEERSLMARLGLTVPLSDPQRGMVHQLALDIANVMMHGEAPVLAGWKFPRRVCFYEQDKRFLKRAFELYDFAEKTLTEYAEDFYESWHEDVPNQGATIALWRARSFARIGKIEEALAALQNGMNSYPVAKDFPLLERAVRDLVDEKPIVPACEKR